MIYNTYSMDKFKDKHPNYFKDYYRKNKEKIKENNKQNYKKKKKYYTIKIAGTIYSFKHKQDIVIKKYTQKELEKHGDYILVT